MYKLEVNNVSKSFDEVKVLSNCSFTVNNDEIVALLGESGSGKSTLLRIIAGFEVADNGEVGLNDKLLLGANVYIKPEHRNIGFIFQDYALFPHLSVEKNIGFGIKDKSKLIAKVDELLEVFELNQQRKSKPSDLSGGQQQRVAIARALAVNPDLLLLDEPFSNLDQNLRRKVRQEILKIHRSFKIPMILVTHDPDDALELADKVAVLQYGEIIQIGKPSDIYFNPVNEYVASLFGDGTWVNGVFYRPEQVEIGGEQYTGVIVEKKFTTRGIVLTLENDEFTILAYDHFNVTKVGDEVNFNLKK